ncbi:MAG TPA: FAD-dependent oxidoreductase [Casimicrobiaceae bacterium]|nr:FAD-dependent oxidoreductase [Casimicrobiaceae bacterium]
MRVAIIGAGIAGLGCAWLLTRQGRHVTLFEANDYLGGHTHTIDVTLDGTTAPVDTGFLVYNDRTYPKLVALFDELEVASTPSAMTFSVRNDAAGIEWSGTDFTSLFAQPSNALRPAFWRMLIDILRFNRETTQMQRERRVDAVTLGEFLDDRGYSLPFREWYLLPMVAAIWSSSSREILGFPLPALVHFCHLHGLLRILDRPQWRSVAGGGRSYVDRIAARLSDVRRATPIRRIRRCGNHVEVDTPVSTAERFDELVMACHSDQALALLTDASREEASLLNSVRFQTNSVALHTDTRLMPKCRRAWSAWNHLAVDDAAGEQPVSVSYWLNELQRLPFKTPLLCTLNPPFPPRAETLIAEFEYSHPLVKSAAVTAQQRFAHLQGQRHTWYAGAWLGYGFHEDGLASAHVVAQGIAACSKIVAAELAAA